MRNRSPKQSKKNLDLLILIFAAVITLYFNPDLQDPFNSPKMWLLILSGSWLVGYFLKFSASIKIRENIFQYKLISILLIFILLLFIAAILSDIRFVAFFGDSGRRIGFLTYFFFAVFMYSSYKFASLNFVENLQKISIFIAFILSSYGMLQYNGKDFVNWSNPYNAIISTLGNPNFASAGMALFAVICLGSFLNEKFHIVLRFISLSLVFTLMFLVFASDSRQGLLAFSVGAALILHVKIRAYKVVLGQIWMLIVGVIASLSILGMLQIGPLQDYLYKTSVSIRGYYWRAGFEMLKANIWFGVGVDSYGTSFKKYREVGYPLNFGFDITTSNAHSIPIQIFSTSGLFTGISYMVLVVFIFYRGVISQIKFKNNNKSMSAIPFAAWLTYQAQSIISIENIGLGVWGWILGGLVVGLSYSISESSTPEQANLAKNKVYQVPITQPLVSGALVLIFTILVSNLYVSEKNVISTRQYFEPNKLTQRAEFYSFASKSLQSEFTDSYYKLQVSELLNLTDQRDLALEQLQKLNLNDPKNLDFLRPLAIVYENRGMLEKAIEVRKEIIINDPWNCDNFLRLGIIYKALGNNSGKTEMLKKIQLIAPNHPILYTARIELS
jgi:O-antigen ligase